MKTDWNIKAKSVESALGVIKASCQKVPDAAILIGAEGSILIDLCDPVIMPYEEVFGIAPTVAGHAGSLTVGRSGMDERAPLVAVFKGRYQLYEGHDWSTVTLPARVVLEWGIKKMLVANSASGLDPQLEVGDLMVLTGVYDLLNPEFKESGLLPALMQAPQPLQNSLTDEILGCAKQLQGHHQDFKPIQQGIYGAWLGPSYTTHSEVDMLAKLGCHAVGMSTAPELLTAKGTKTEAAAVSLITNVWSQNKPLGGQKEFLESSKKWSFRLDQLFKSVLSEWPGTR